MLIGIAGLPGSGTSTLAKLLSKHLGIPIVSTGSVFRQWAQKSNLSLEEFGTIVDNNPMLDQKLDDAIVQEVSRIGDCIVEGRTVAKFFPHADILIWLYADQETRASRVNNRDNETLEQMQRREEHEIKRYLSNYNIQINCCDNYDICINTKKFDVNTIYTIILACIT